MGKDSGLWPTSGRGSSKSSGQLLKCGEGNKYLGPQWVLGSMSSNLGSSSFGNLSWTQDHGPLLRHRDPSWE